MASTRLVSSLCLLFCLCNCGTSGSPLTVSFTQQGNVQEFIKLIGSLDPNVSSINYLNGSVFGKRPGQELQKLFNFEGYNINRKQVQSDGSYLSLSREFVVYRDPNTAAIQTVWMNPWTSKPNEIFFVANDPVNALLSADSNFPSLDIHGGRVVFNTDIVLEYPNPLQPSKYRNYSAGDIYDSVELFGFFTNDSSRLSSADQSVPMTGTWVRKSQYLPWMEMSDSPGGLYYTTMSWKCNEGLSCVADDIMELIREHYSKYETAPLTDETPNETSWGVFKKVIDSRRSAGQPDIIIPQVNATKPVSIKTTSIDSRVLDVLYSYPMSLSLTGTVWTEIIGNQSITLFNARGNVRLDVEPIPEVGGYRLQLDGSVEFLDVNTGKRISLWKNPITGQDVFVKTPMIGVDLVVHEDFIYTMDIPTSSAVGLLAAMSVEGEGQNSGNWSVNFADVIFEYSELAKTPNKTMFYGTAAGFSNWFEWMQMDDIPGNLVMKATISRLVFD